MQSPALAVCSPSSRAGKRTSLGTRTRLSNVQDLAEDQSELDAAPSKGTLMFVFPTAVLEDKLEKRAITSRYMDLEGYPNSGCQTCHAPPAFLVKLSPQQVKPSLTQATHSSQNPAPASSFPCGSVGAGHRHCRLEHGSCPAGFVQTAPVCSRHGNQAVSKPLNIMGTLQRHWPQMVSPTHRKDSSPSETEQGHLRGCGQGQINHKERKRTWRFTSTSPSGSSLGEHSTYPAVGIRGVLREIHHVVQSKESWWGTAEILCWVAVVLGGHKGCNLAAVALFFKQQCLPNTAMGFAFESQHSTALAVQECRGSRRERYCMVVPQHQQGHLAPGNHQKVPPRPCGGASVGLRRGCRGNTPRSPACGIPWRTGIAGARC